jgi:hypothetical protein
MRRKDLRSGKLNFTIVCLAMLLIGTVPLLSMRHTPKIISNPVYRSVIAAEKKENKKNEIYDSLHLANLGLSRTAFEEGVAGHDSLLSTGDIQNSNILSIVDLSLPSSKKRLFVIDLKTYKLIFHTYVSHGKNSGKEMATQFSNEPRSGESSLGFYVTGTTYIGHHGYSLRLNGKEEGINDNALTRGIVMHSAAYVNERMVAKHGFIGRSEGCPAIPRILYKKIIEKIKNGSCLFLYSPDPFYTTHSKMRYAWMG